MVRSVVREVCKMTHATTDVSTLLVLAPTVNIPVEEFLFESGWGKTHAHGTKCGCKYIEPFKAEIVKNVQRGKGLLRKEEGAGSYDCRTQEKISYPLGFTIRI